MFVALKYDADFLKNVHAIRLMLQCTIATTASYLFDFDSSTCFHVCNVMLGWNMALLTHRPWQPTEDSGSRKHTHLKWLGP